MPRVPYRNTRGGRSQAQLSQMKEAERERLARMFNGKSLYAKEEKEERRKAAEKVRLL